MENFVEFVAKKLQNHTGKTLVKVVKPGNIRSPKIYENKLRNKVNKLKGCIKEKKLEQIMRKTE
jgi:hypothetical protein